MRPRSKRPGEASWLSVAPRKMVQEGVRYEDVEIHSRLTFSTRHRDKDGTQAGYIRSWWCTQRSTTYGIRSHGIGSQLWMIFLQSSVWTSVKNDWRTMDLWSQSCSWLVFFGFVDGPGWYEMVEISTLCVYISTTVMVLGQMTVRKIYWRPCEVIVKIILWHIYRCFFFCLRKS